MPDPKYQFGESDTITHRQHGYTLPADEPVFLLRAKDAAALPLLRHYLTICDDWHRESAAERVEAFEQFAEKNPNRVGVPCTEGNTSD